MDFKIYIKIRNTNKYELRKVNYPSDNTREFFLRLLKNVNDELDYIKQDILSFGTEEYPISLKKPVHDDWEITKKLEKLSIIRKNNLIIKEQIKEILSEVEFLICEHCGSKMYKRPLNTSFKKIGHNYVVYSDNIVDIRYNFGCENCVYNLDEGDYYERQENRKRKNNLLDEGYNFVPNDFGFWHYIDNGQPPTKSPDMVDNEPRYSYRREYKEYMNGDSIGIKVFDICVETGERIERIPE